MARLVVALWLVVSVLDWGNGALSARECQEKKQEQDETAMAHGFIVRDELRNSRRRVR